MAHCQRPRQRRVGWKQQSMWRAQPAAHECDTKHLQATSTSQTWTRMTAMHHQATQLCQQHASWTRAGDGAARTSDTKHVLLLRSSQSHILFHTMHKIISSHIPQNATGRLHHTVGQRQHVIAQTHTKGAQAVACHRSISIPSSPSRTRFLENLRARLSAPMRSNSTTRRS